jgi:hypothetical protein
MLRTLFSRRLTPIDPTRYQPDPLNADLGSRVEIFHLDGIKWMDAPVPPKRHTCFAQTMGYYEYFNSIERCACGAASYGRVWMDRNSRKAAA